MDANVISALKKTAEGLVALAVALETGKIGVPDPPNLTVKDVADLLACGEDTVRSAVHREVDPIPACKVGALLRFRRSEVMEWAGRQKPKSDPARALLPVQSSPVVATGVRKARRRAVA